MKNKFSSILYLTSALFFSVCITTTFGQDNGAAAGQHAFLNMQVDTTGRTRSNPHPRAAWFPKAGLGLFIHWGALATYGGGDLSWCMLANKSWVGAGTVTPNFYYSLMEGWDPKNYDPNALIKQAKAAGFQYAVLVTKHHDGYTLWPSRYGDLGTQTKMHGRDLVKPFVEACRKYGLKVGFYYSPPDWWFDRAYRNWSFNNKIFLDMDHNPLPRLADKPQGHDAERVKLVANQVRELLTNYGKIDLFWFDGGKGEISNAELRKLQPGIVINRRNGTPGDYDDSEGKLPEKRFQGWFETNDPVWPSRFWSYSTCDTYDDASMVLTNLIKLRAWGGNYLANLAPDGTGAIPAPALVAMRGMAEWMKHSGESIFNVQGGNYPEVSAVPVTIKGNIIYAFALPAYQDVLKIGTDRIPKKVILLRTGQTLSFSSHGRFLHVTIPPASRSRMPDAVKVVL